MTLNRQTPQMRVDATIPASAGIGLRSPHQRAVLENPGRVSWLEVHSENYFGRGGAPLSYLDAIRADHPISLHGVGMSLGSVDELDMVHLHKLKQLIARIEPGLVSEHLSWSSFGGRYLNDLAPLPYRNNTLKHLMARVSRVQEFLGRQILIENPSSYLEYQCADYTESGFLHELACRTGCGILLDLNNLYVSCHNHGWDADDYLRELPANKIGELHLAGHTLKHVGRRQILIDTHDSPVADAVWQLYRAALRYLGKLPTLIEWDANMPALPVLEREAAKADAYLEACYAQAA